MLGARRRKRAIVIHSQLILIRNQVISLGAELIVCRSKLIVAREQLAKLAQEGLSALACSLTSSLDVDDLQSIRLTRRRTAISVRGLIFNWRRGREPMVTLLTTDRAADVHSLDAQSRLAGRANDSNARGRRSTR
jgi:hypothetical protein